PAVIIATIYSPDMPSPRAATGLIVVMLFLATGLPRGQSHPDLPAPQSVLTFEPRADYKLATYDQSIEYFKKLDGASKYLTLVEAGRTSQGRPMYFALIS